MVQVELLRLLLSIAAALPGKHGPLDPRASGRGTRLAEAPVAIQQKGPGDFGRSIIEKREDKQLIPENMALVVLPGPAARRHADVESDGLGRHRLQQVKHVQPQEHRDV